MFGTIFICPLSACSPPEGFGADSNLECAALISASTYLVNSGKAERDPVLAKRVALTGMSHLNKYAIPRKIKQAEAFKKMKVIRDELMDTRPPDEIMARARRCSDRIPW